MKRIVLFTLFAMTGIMGYSQNLSFEYPIKPGNPKWKAIDNTLEKIKLCQLPDSVLKEANTDELLDICLQYPLLHDYRYANSPYQGLQAVVAMFNGLVEFTNRNDAIKIWLYKYALAQPSDVSKYAQLADKGRFMSDFTALELLVTNDRLFSKMTIEEKKSCLKLLVKNSDVKNQYKEHYGLFGDATTAFIGRKIIKTLKPDEPVVERPDAATAEKNKLKEIFENTMLVASPTTVSNALNEVKEYVKNLN